ncbi:MAG: hypothetical protein AB1782_03390 [Cyanobacteriota bacterium]
MNNKHLYIIIFLCIFYSTFIIFSYAENTEEKDVKIKENTQNNEIVKVKIFLKRATYSTSGTCITSRGDTNNCCNENYLNSDNYIELIYPNNNILDNNPTFEWFVYGDVNSFDFNLYSYNEPVYTTTTEEHSLSLPVNSIYLKENKYYCWSVKPSGQSEDMSRKACFYIKDKLKKKKLNEAFLQLEKELKIDNNLTPFEKNLIMGAFYHKKKFYNEAIKYYKEAEKVINSEEDKKQLSMLLSRVYFIIGLCKKSEECEDTKALRKQYCHKEEK